jgi:hypothetical protein
VNQIFFNKWRQKFVFFSLKNGAKSKNFQKISPQVNQFFNGAKSRFFSLKNGAKSGLF